MKRFFQIALFLLALAVTVSLHAAEGTLIYWEIASDGDPSIADFEVTYDAGLETERTVSLSETDLGGQFNAARLRYQNADASTVGYLDVYIVEQGVDDLQILPASPVAMLDASVFSPIDLADGLSAEAVSFYVELGNFADGTWTKTVLESDGITYAELASDTYDSIVQWEDIASGIANFPYTPSHFNVVPEPSSGLLLLMGSALLALKRRRGGKHLDGSCAKAEV